MDNNFIEKYPIRKDLTEKILALSLQKMENSAKDKLSLDFGKTDHRELLDALIFIKKVFSEDMEKSDMSLLKGYLDEINLGDN